MDSRRSATRFILKMKIEANETIFPRIHALSRSNIKYHHAAIYCSEYYSFLVLYITWTPILPMVMRSNQIFYRTIISHTFLLLLLMFLLLLFLCLSKFNIYEYCFMAIRKFRATICLIKRTKFDELTVSQMELKNKRKTFAFCITIRTFDHYWFVFVVVIVVVIKYA